MTLSSGVGTIKRAQTGVLPEIIHKLQSNSGVVYTQSAENYERLLKERGCVATYRRPGLVPKTRVKLVSGSWLASRKSFGPVEWRSPARNRKNPRCGPVGHKQYSIHKPQAPNVPIHNTKGCVQLPVGGVVQCDPG